MTEPTQATKPEVFTKPNRVEAAVAALKDGPPKADAQQAQPDSAPAEAPKEPAAEPKQEPGFDSKFAALTKAEKRIRQERQEVEEARKAVEQERASFGVFLEAKKAAESGDMVKAADLLGLDVEEWAYQKTGKQKPKEPEYKVPDELLKEIEELKAYRESTEKEKQEREFAEQAARADKLALDSFSELLENNGDKYGYTLAQGGAEFVLKFVKSNQNLFLTYDEDGQPSLPEFGEIVDQIESSLEANASKFLDVPKHRQKIPEPKQTAKEPVAESLTKLQPADRVPAGRLSSEERMARAYAAFKNGPAL